jgi:hypothetical protein
LKWSLYIRFSHQNPACTFPLPYISACPSHLILLDLFNRKTFSDQYKSLSSSLCSFLHSSVTLPLFGPSNHLSILFLNTLNLRFSLM